MGVTWTIEIHIPAAAADAFEAAIMPFCEVVSGFEAPDRGDTWQLLGYAPAAPDRGALTAALSVAALAAQVPVPDLRVLPLAPRDWLAENRKAFAPVVAGRYFVQSDSFDRVPPPGMVAVTLNAGPAFGSGTHETTRGCLLALSQLAEQGWRPQRILDLGTGSGILAIAAALTWPGLDRGAIMASDINPVATRTAAENAEKNGVGNRVHCRTAAGLSGLNRRGRADLIFANILAGPLMVMAGELAGCLTPGGHLVLSGLLAHQAAGVDALYRARRLDPLPAILLGDWATLRYRGPA